MDVVVQRGENLLRAGVDCASQLFGHVHGDVVASSRVSDANCVRLLLTGSDQRRPRSSYVNILQKVAVPQIDQVQNVNVAIGRWSSIGVVDKTLECGRYFICFINPYSMSTSTCS